MKFMRKVADEAVAIQTYEDDSTCLLKSVLITESMISKPVWLLIPGLAEGLLIYKDNINI